MTPPSSLKANASKWLEYWNGRDLDKIMEHYSDNAELYSPVVRERWSLPDGMITGKDQIRRHFEKAFELGIKLELIEVLTGIGGFILLYKRPTGGVSADLVELDDDGKVKTVRAFYPSVTE